MSRHTFESVEKEAFQNGYRSILGVDEAGRGCLAGPVALGFASFSPPFFQQDHPPGELSGLRDSKKLSPAKRKQLLPGIYQHAVFTRTVFVSARMIDQLGINPAIEFGLIRGYLYARISGLDPDLILVDGNYRFNRFRHLFPGIEIRSITGGDDRVFSIAAGSILAKVRRDERMALYNRLFPGYQLDQHKGYGTSLHREAINSLGPAAIHRKSYRW